MNAELTSITHWSTSRDMGYVATRAWPPLFFWKAELLQLHTVFLQLKIFLMYRTNGSFWSVVSYGTARLNKEHFLGIKAIGIQILKKSVNVKKKYCIMTGINSMWLEFLLYKCFILDSCTSSWEFLEMTAPDDSFPDDWIQWNIYFVKN